MRRYNHRGYWLRTNVILRCAYPRRLLYYCSGPGFYFHLLPPYLGLIVFVYNYLSIENNSRVCGQGLYVYIFIDTQFNAVFDNLKSRNLDWNAAFFKVFFNTKLKQVFKMLYNIHQASFFLLFLGCKKQIIFFSSYDPIRGLPLTLKLCVSKLLNFALNLFATLSQALIIILLKLLVLSWAFASELNVFILHQCHVRLF